MRRAIGRASAMLKRNFKASDFNAVGEVMTMARSSLALRMASSNLPSLNVVYRSNFRVTTDLRITPE